MGNTVYGISKFLPGQVWFMEIDTEKIDGNWSKKRPYFIVAANTRRLVVLRMTHGGEGGTNWLYRIDIDEDKPTNIICDAPITVSVEKIRETAEYKWTFSQDMVMDILKYHFASIMHQSMAGILEGNGSNDILELINNHQDRNRAFGKYMVVFDGEEEEDDKDEQNEQNDILEEEETEVTTEDDTIIEPKVEIATATFDEEGKIIDITPASVEEVEVKEKTHAEKIEKPKTKTTRNKMVGNRDYIVASDVLIFKTGVTRDNEIYAELERLGIKNPKFVMSDLINRNKVTYNNNRYNVTLKSKLRVNSKIFGKEKYNEMAIADIKELGITNAAKIYNVTYNAFWKRWNDHCKAEVIAARSKAEVVG